MGGGPAGLATAAMLVERGEEVVVLERRESIQGGWRQHFEGANTFAVPRRTRRAAERAVP